MEIFMGEYLANAEGTKKVQFSSPLSDSVHLDCFALVQGKMLSLVFGPR